MLIDFRERRSGRERWSGRERSTLMWELSIGCLPHAPLQGMKPSAFAVWDDAPTNWATWPGWEELLCGHWETYQRAEDLPGSFCPMARSITVCLGGWGMEYRVSGYRHGVQRPSLWRTGPREWLTGAEGGYLRVPPLPSSISFLKMTIQLSDDKWFFSSCLSLLFFKLSMSGCYLCNKKVKCQVLGPLRRLRWGGC